MGAYTPAPIMTEDMNRRVMEEIVIPTVKALKKAGAPFKGVLFAGLMITKDGPQLIEYNVRFGDPETQVLMLRLASDILPALIASRDGTLKIVSLKLADDAALTVVMAAKGYPGAYAKGTLIEGLTEAAKAEGVEIFHAGTKTDGGRILANGGRVLNVTARGKSVREAQLRAYAAVDRVRWPEGFCRRDIGWRAVERESCRHALSFVMAGLDPAIPLRKVLPSLSGSPGQARRCQANVLPELKMHPVLRLYED